MLIISIYKVHARAYVKQTALLTRSCSEVSSRVLSDIEVAGKLQMGVFYIEY